MHIGNFNASIIFNHKYCNTLDSFKIQVTNNKSNSCSVDNAKVLWRVGKEAYMQINKQMITVPSDQILSMTWPPIEPNDNNITKPDVVTFEFNSTALTKNGKQELLKQVKALDNNNTKEITIYGCASPEGTEKYNKTLSLERAQSVQSWIDGYLARGSIQIKTKVIAEGTSKHCSDDKLIQDLKEHRKVIIQ